jgi:hypothetical protein
VKIQNKKFVESKISPLWGLGILFINVGLLSFHPSGVIINPHSNRNPNFFPHKTQNKDFSSHPYLQILLCSSWLFYVFALNVMPASQQPTVNSHPTLKLRLTEPIYYFIVGS